MSSPSDPDDLELFRQHMDGIEPLRHDKITTLKSTDIAAKITPSRGPFSDNVPLHHLAEPNVLVGQEESLHFRRSGIQERQLSKLRQGQIAMEAELDLHGMTTAVAYQALDDFLSECQQLMIRGARIIHGKGWSSAHHKPILKTKVNQWLRERESVLAFCSARTQDGGTGAVYVLLRRQDKPKRS